MLSFFRFLLFVTTRASFPMLWARKRLCLYRNTSTSLHKFDFRLLFLFLFIVDPWLASERAEGYRVRKNTWSLSTSGSDWRIRSVLGTIVKIYSSSGRLPPTTISLKERNRSEGLESNSSHSFVRSAISSSNSQFFPLAMLILVKTGIPRGSTAWGPL